MANIVNACSQLQYNNEDVLLPACHELARPYRVRHITPANITLATYALCRLQFYDSKYFSAYLAEATNGSRIKLMRPATLIDLMFGCIRADVVHFVQFMEIIKSDTTPATLHPASCCFRLLRDPKRVNNLHNFPLVRLISVASVQGLRDEAFMNTIKDEVCDPQKEFRVHCLLVLCISFSKKTDKEASHMLNDEMWHVLSNALGVSMRICVQH